MVTGQNAVWFNPSRPPQSRARRTFCLPPVSICSEQPNYAGMPRTRCLRSSITRPEMQPPASPRKGTKRLTQRIRGAFGSKPTGCWTTWSITSRTIERASLATDSRRRRFCGAVPRLPADSGAVHEDFMRDVLPFAAGNVPPSAPLQIVMCSGLISRPVPTRILALSTTFRNSRTLPGHVWRLRTSAASGLNATL